MNKANVQRLIDELRKDVSHDPVRDQPLYFAMDRWVDPVYHLGDECGTFGCVAGFSFLLAADEGHPEALRIAQKAVLDGRRIDTVQISAIAKQWLGLDRMQAQRLFYGEDSCVALSAITREATINVLEELMDTGFVSWDIHTEHLVDEDGIDEDQ